MKEIKDKYINDDYSIVIMLDEIYFPSLTCPLTKNGNLFSSWNSAYAFMSWSFGWVLLWFIYLLSLAQDNCNGAHPYENETNSLWKEVSYKSKC